MHFTGRRAFTKPAVRAALLLTLGMQCPLALLGQETAASPAARTGGGAILGVGFTGFSQTSADGTSGTSSGQYATAPYVGLFLRRSLTRWVHANAEAIIEVLADHNAQVSMGYAHFPIVLEIVPMPAGSARTFVRPLLQVGLSPGIRLSTSGGHGDPSSLRSAELAAIVGAGAEVHFGNGGWAQLLGRVQLGVSDLSPSPGKTMSQVYALVLKLHPERRD